MTVESPGDLPRKLQSVQALRACAALIVLLYHLVNTSAFGWTGIGGEGGLLAAFISATGFAGVDLFFVISGVVMVVTCYDRFGQPREIGPFLVRRAARIYPLYWLATCGVLAIAWIRPGLAARDKFDGAAMVKSLLLWPQDEYPIVAVGWTLSYELFFYLGFAGLVLLPRRLLPAALAAWSVATVVMYLEYADPAHKLTPEGHLSLPLYASPLALEFIAGCAIGWMTARNINGYARMVLGIGIALLVVAGGYVGIAFPQEAHYGLVRAGVFGGAASLIAYGLIGLEMRGLLRTPRWVVFWGDASYSTYLTHMYVLWLLAAAWSGGASGNSAASIGLKEAWMRTACGIAACGAVAAACHVGVERPLNRNLAKRIAAAGNPSGGASPIA